MPDFQDAPDPEIARRIKAVDETKAKYGDNHWWDSKDPYVLGYYQMNEPILIVDFGDFHAAFEKLLGRPVWTHEFGLDHEGLKAEAESRFKAYRDGKDMSTPDTFKQAAQDNAIKSLIRFGQKNNKPVIILSKDGDDS